MPAETYNLRGAIVRAEDAHDTQAERGSGRSAALASHCCATAFISISSREPCQPLRRMLLADDLPFEGNGP